VPPPHDEAFKDSTPFENADLEVSLCKNEISDSELISVLRKGVQRSSNLIAQITDYHGGPVTTEYMLTSDIARELIEQNYQVEVEYLNRNMINGMTMRLHGRPRKKFGSHRTDVAVLTVKCVLLAIIEVKIGVKTLNAIKKDLLKITDTAGTEGTLKASDTSWCLLCFAAQNPAPQMKSGISLQSL
jgi:hypothetical protein